MNRSAPRSPDEIAEIYDRQFPAVWRVCRVILKNDADAEDAVSDVFLALIRSSPVFESAEHEKAWLLRTAINRCRSLLRSHARRTVSLDRMEENGELPASPDGGDREAEELREAVESLPERYRIAVLLHYYDGYASEEIGKIIGKPSSTVRNWLSEARKLLRERMGET